MLPENSNPAEQPTHSALRLIAARPDIFSHQGHIVATYRRKAAATLGSEKVYGPYYHLNYRENGRQRAVYLGTAAAVVEAVRKALAQMQQPLAQRRLFNAINSAAREAIRKEKRRIAMLLRPFGLRLKGIELRGWRTCTIRTLLPRVPHSLPKMSPRIRPGKKHPIESPLSRLHRFLDARDHVRANT